MHQKNLNTTFLAVAKSSKVLADFDGMNYYASKQLGFDYAMAPNVIFVKDTLSNDKKASVILHEMTEAYLMQRGMTYFRAHRKALEAEKNKQAVNSILMLVKKGNFIFAL
jgi:hypothetical protein